MEKCWTSGNCAEAASLYHLPSTIYHFLFTSPGWMRSAIGRGETRNAADVGPAARAAALAAAAAAGRPRSPPES